MTLGSYCKERLYQLPPLHIFCNQPTTSRREFIQVSLLPHAGHRGACRSNETLVCPRPPLVHRLITWVDAEASTMHIFRSLPAARPPASHSSHKTASGYLVLFRRPVDTHGLRPSLDSSNRVPGWRQFAPYGSYHYWRCAGVARSKVSILVLRHF